MPSQASQPQVAPQSSNTMNVVEGVESLYVSNLSVEEKVNSFKYMHYKDTYIKLYI